MGKRTGRKKRMSHDEAVARLADVRKRVADTTIRHAEMSQEAGRKVAELMKPVREVEQSLRGLRLLEGSLQRIVDRGPGAAPMLRQVVENPHRSDGLVEAELEAGEGPAGLIEVSVRLVTQIGGLARFSGHLDEFQMAAAARFRNCWDKAQIGGARAIDYASPRVDTSGSSQESMMATTDDAIEQYKRAVQKLGPIKSNLVQRVICEEMSLRQLGRKLGRPAGGKATEKLREEVLEAVDGLVKVFKTKAVSHRSDMRRGGEVLPMPEGRREVVYGAEDGAEVNNAA